MNCKNCEWLSYYDGYFCGNPNSPINDEEFIKDIEKQVCSEFDKREGKFWISEEGEF